MTTNVEAAKRIAIIAGIAAAELCRVTFDAWFKLSPDAARDWLNRKLEDARREDAKSSPR